MSSSYSFPDLQSAPARQEQAATGFPHAAHPAELDLFCRQAAMPGHHQPSIEDSHVAVVGCGGLGSWVALGLARAGVRRLTLVDPDLFDRTNAPRQLMEAQDLGCSKAHSLARNVLPHMTNRGTIVSIARAWGDALPLLSKPVDVLTVGLDNNAARLATANYARKIGIPAVFSMLSLDGLRTQVFRQDPAGPCLLCVLPNLSSEGAAPCAAANIASCLLAASHALMMTLAALDSRPGVPTWRESSLDGSTERFGYPSPRAGCRLCGRTTGG
jgi:adenylyltransferase/sulfurtransferase